MPVNEERRDNMLGGAAIILLGVLLFGSAIWGLAFGIYSMNGGWAPPFFIILGLGSIIMGAIIFRRKPEANPA